VLADIDEAERCVTAGSGARGRVVINASVAFGLHMLVPLVPRFIAQHPQVVLDIMLTDRVVDLMDERADIAIRWGPLPSSDLIARRLGETAQSIVGSPDYLARHGTPRKPADLQKHRQLDFSYRRRVPDWPLRVDGQVLAVPVQGSVRASNGEALRQLALAGAGLARLSRYAVQHDLDAGRLVAVLEKYNPRDAAPIHAVYLGKVDRVPARVKVVLDFLVEHLSVDSRMRA
jgi:DNA-binding transcriptional LysR family regulator